MATTLRGDDNFDTASPIPAGDFTAKAWVNFNGTGTVAIRASGNVSSITDNGVGSYSINFTTAVADANFSVQATSSIVGGAGQLCRADSPTTSRVTIVTTDHAGTARDTGYVYAAVFR